MCSIFPTTRTHMHNYIKQTHIQGLSLLLNLIFSLPVIASQARPFWPWGFHNFFRMGRQQSTPIFSFVGHKLCSLQLVNVFIWLSKHSIMVSHSHPLVLRRRRGTCRSCTRKSSTTHSMSRVRHEGVRIRGEESPPSWTNWGVRTTPHLPGGSGLARGGGACLKNGQPFFLSALCAEEHFLVNFCRKWPTMVLLAVFGGRGEQVRARRKALDRILVTRTLCHCTGVWGSNPPPQLPLCQTLPTSRALTMWFPSMGCPCTSVHIFHVHIMHTIFLMPTSNTQGIHSKIIV